MLQPSVANLAQNVAVGRSVLVSLSILGLVHSVVHPKANTPLTPKTQRIIQLSNVKFPE